MPTMKRFNNSAHSKHSINVSVLFPNSTISVSSIKNLALRALKMEGKRNAVLNVVFVGDRAIRRLNKKFMHKDSSTDVLCFDLRGFLDAKSVLRADIVVSYDAAKRNSGKFRISTDEEIARYVIHGILHLTGYDDLTQKEKKKMWKRQEEILTKVFK